MISLQKDKTGGFAEFCWLLCIPYLIFQLRRELRFLPEFSLSRLPNWEGTGETYRDELSGAELGVSAAGQGPAWTDFVCTHVSISHCPHSMSSQIGWAAFAVFLVLSIVSEMPSKCLATIY